MTVVELEGPAGDLAEALGLIEDGRLQSDFLSDPGTTLKGMLVDAERREKLLAVVQALLAQADLGVGPAGTVDGRDWLPVIGNDVGDDGSNHVDVSIVLDHSEAAHTLVGIGVRYTHDASDGPRLALEAIVPLVVVPSVGDAALAPGRLMATSASTWCWSRALRAATWISSLSARCSTCRPTASARRAWSSPRTGSASAMAIRPTSCWTPATLSSTRRSTSPPRCCAG